MAPGNYTPVALIDPIGVSLTMEELIPTQYRNSDHFRIFYSFDGSQPTSHSHRKGTFFTDGYPGDLLDYSLPAWGGASTLSVRVAALSSRPDILTDSDVESAEIGIERIQLPAPVIDVPSSPRHGDLVDFSLLVDSGNVPVGARIYYNLNGVDPGDDGFGNPTSGTLYTGSFDPLAMRDYCAVQSSIKARVYPPKSYRQWFVVSDAVEADYSISAWSLTTTAGGDFDISDGVSAGVHNRAVLYTSATGDGSNDLLGLDSAFMLDFALSAMLSFDLFGNVVSLNDDDANISDLANLQSSATGNFLGGRTELDIKTEIEAGADINDSLFANINFSAEILANNASGALNLCYCGMMETDFDGNLGSSGAALSTLNSFTQQPDGNLSTAGALSTVMALTASGNEGPLNVFSWF